MSRKGKKILKDLPLTGMHPSGRSYGYWGSRKVYTSQGIPGESVDLVIQSKQRDWLSGDVIAVKQSSPLRTDPFCRHSSICGGCQWQHVSYDTQLQWKHKFLKDAFLKYGIISPEIPHPIAAPTTTFYRHRLDYSFSARRWYYVGEGIISDPSLRSAMGFHPENNPNKVLDIEECFLQAFPSRKICELVRTFTQEYKLSFYDPKEKTGLMRILSIRMNRAGKVMLIFSFAESPPQEMNQLYKLLQTQIPEIESLWWGIAADITQTWSDCNLHLVEGSIPYLFEEANGLIFRMSPKSFYQPNPIQAERIFKDIGQQAEIRGNETIFDLYSGIGTLGLSVAAMAGVVIGIEGSADATRDAAFNAINNGFRNCTFIEGDVLRTFNSEFLEKYGKPDLIILDPPRSGTLIEIKKTMLEAAPGKIIYLSCDPLSLAYDLKMLTNGYHISHIQPYDQFPYTHHLETLVVLERDA
jgi:23S rRNA (uracil1939-C5)-methyltransferase